MSGLIDSLTGGGSEPKVVKPEPPKPVPPIPTATEEASEQARKKRPRGRDETFLTGDLIPETTKRRVLG